MIRILSRAFVASLAAFVISPAQAWWDAGHMQIAYLAYQKLMPAVRDRVDVLLKLNADYEKWTCGVPDPAIARMYAFVHAATWADDIKEKSGYENDAVGDSGADQNIGYADKKKHEYWHYKDVLYSPDGTPLPRPDPVDAVTQLKTMMSALPSTSTATDDIRSYDLVWILHLVGDIHQPLHAVQRPTAQIPSGDRGGNSEKVVPATGETVALHAYWDRVFGGYSSPYGAVFDASTRGGIAELRPDPALVAVSDPDEWVRESFELAKRFAYGKRWQAEVGLVTDGASIPWPLWSIVGAPFEGPYRRAAVIHDFYCDRKFRTWQKTHRVFYDAMITAGVSTGKAKLMYYAVWRFGPRWLVTEIVPCLPDPSIGKYCATTKPTSLEIAVERPVLSQSEMASAKAEVSDVDALLNREDFSLRRSRGS